MEVMFLTHPHIGISNAAPDTTGMVLLECRYGSGFYAPDSEYRLGLCVSDMAGFEGRCWCLLPCHDRFVSAILMTVLMTVDRRED
jgi:hypothetical protein